LPQLTKKVRKKENGKDEEREMNGGIFSFLLENWFLHLLTFRIYLSCIILASFFIALPELFPYTARRSANHTRHFPHFHWIHLTGSHHWISHLIWCH